MKRTATARRWIRGGAVLGGAIGAIVAACHNDVPGPTLPIPTPEVSPVGPRPKPLTPMPTRIDSDAGVPLPTPEPGEANLGRPSKPVRVAHVPEDAALPDATDLPPVPDADVTLLPDAGRPLR